MHHPPTLASQVLGATTGGLPARHAARLAWVQRLADRAAFDALVTVQTARCRRAGEALGVLWLTLDTGTEVDLAPLAVEPLILDCADRLARCVRRTDQLLYCTGRHFGVLLPGADEPATTRAGERLCLACSGPYQLADRLLAVRLTVDLQCFAGAFPLAAATATPAHPS